MRNEDIASLVREADAAIARLLAAETEALAAVAECVRHAEQVVRDAEARAKRIQSRADERISHIRERLGARASGRIAALQTEKSRLREAEALDAGALERLERTIERVVLEMTSG